jgi:heparosan-N-sulfate-glucuronate 5-epimerase
MSEGRLFSPRIVLIVFASILLASIGLLLLSSNTEIPGLFSKPVYAQRANITLDKSGVAVTDYGNISAPYIGVQRNPVHIAQKALQYYDKYNETNNARFLDVFLNNSNWLVQNAVPRANYSLLQYDFPWPSYKMDAPWQSSLAQGRALDVLTKAHQITGNKTYLDAAKSLLNAFFVEVKDGGVTLKSPNDGWWYEGYASNNGSNSGVLSSMLAALKSIYGYYQYTQDPSAKFLFDQGVIALNNTLPRFEYFEGAYSTFDATNNKKPASFNTHMRNVILLGELYDITNEPNFKVYHDKWQNFEISENLAKRLDIEDSVGKTSSINNNMPLIPPLFYNSR